MVNLVRMKLSVIVNLGKSITKRDHDDKWTDVEAAIKDYDQMILDLVANEIMGVCTLVSF